jgi:diamine N-acetyltransferase
MEKQLKEIASHLNEKGQVISWLSKPKKQLGVLRYLGDQFELGKNYTEAEVNGILNTLHTFSDPALLRRELYMKKILDRTSDGHKYWKMRRQLPASWTTERLSVQDSREDELDDLQRIYESCSYIGVWTGSAKASAEPMRTELRHEYLPPQGLLENHRVQSISLKDSNAMMGYLICYHGYPDEKTFWIGTLAVDPAFQKKAYGQELMKCLIEELRKLHVFRHAVALVSIKNWPALRFWVEAP